MVSKLRETPGGEPDTGQAQPLPVGQYRSLTQILVTSLRDRIFAGTYRPGARLNIADLAQQFNVSPVPLREALRNLEAEGLVEFRLNRGVVVRELSGADVRELYLMRVPLETLVAVEATERATPEKLNDLEAILFEMDTLLGTEKWHTLHDRFHHDFYSISGLPRAVQLVEVLRGQMRPYSRTFLENRRHLSAAQSEHYGMVEAARDKNTDRIRAIIHEHLKRPSDIAISALAETSGASRSS
jgi:DNA-binding GntR family transcriptional regulator